MPVLRKLLSPALISNLVINGRAVVAPSASKKLIVEMESEHKPFYITETEFPESSELHFQPETIANKVSRSSVTSGFGAKGLLGDSNSITKSASTPNFV